MMSRLLVLLWLVALTASQSNSSATSTRSGRADHEVRELSTACLSLRQEYRAYPSETNWLEELTAQPSATLNTKGLLFIDIPRSFDAQGHPSPCHEFLDPWRHPYIYRYPGRWNTNGPDIYSMGADGKTTTDGNDNDDINSWNKDRPWRRYYKWQPLFFPIMAVLFAVALVVVTWLVSRGHPSNPKLTRILAYAPTLIAVLSLALYGFYELGSHHLILEISGRWLSLSGLLIGLIISRTFPSHKIILVVGTVLPVIATICCWLLTSV